MERMQINWENELAMLEQSGKDIKSMKYNKGVALKDSKGFNGTALSIGIVEYFIQKNSEVNSCTYISKYNSLNGIVNRLVNLYGEDVLYDAYVNSPAKLEQLMGQHKIDYIDFAGRIDLHYKNLTKDPKLAEAFLNQDINSSLECLEQALEKDYDKEHVLVNQIEILKEEVSTKVEEYPKIEEPKIELNQVVNTEEIKTEPIKSYSNYVSGVTVDLESNQNDNRTDFFKSVERQINKIIEEREAKENLSTEQTVIQQISVNEPKANELKIDEPKKVEFTTVHNLSQEEKIEQLVREVLAGKYGSGRERRHALGDLYNIVQARVNQIAIASARGNQYGIIENPTVEQPIVENSGNFELVLQKQEKKQNLFLRGWHKFANSFKKIFWRHNGDKVLALNPGTTVDESMQK